METHDDFTWVGDNSEAPTVQRPVTKREDLPSMAELGYELWMGHRELVAPQVASQMSGGRQRARHTDGSQPRREAGIGTRRPERSVKIKSYLVSVTRGKFES